VGVAIDDQCIDNCVSNIFILCQNAPPSRIELLAPQVLEPHPFPRHELSLICNIARFALSVADGASFLVEVGDEKPIDLVGEIRSARAAGEGNSKCDSALADAVGKVADTVTTVSKAGNSDKTDEALAAIAESMAEVAEQLARFVNSTASSASGSGSIFGPRPIAWAYVLADHTIHERAADVFKDDDVAKPVTGGSKLTFHGFG
jgi:hypothetical protein